MKTVYSIHPAIGVARLGDSGYDEGTGWDGSKASYFIGPEAPEIQFVPQSYAHENSGDGIGKYRNENDNKIRRQGARFRIYKKEIDDNGVVISAKEITLADASISWQVSIANRKAVGERFPPYHNRLLRELANHSLPDGTGNYPNMVMRNFDLTGDERNRLIIEAEDVIDGDSDDTVMLQGLFLDSPVKLADLLTDDQGRLIFLGGHGFSKSPNSRGPREPAILGTVRDNDALPDELQRLGSWHRLYNWDGWCDDTSDGIISASVVLNGQSEALPVETAWVTVAPPDHAAAAKSPVTLYDLMYSTIRKAKKQQGLPIPPLSVSFVRDIYPILRRTVDLQYVSDRARLGHSGDAAGNFTKEENITRLSSKSEDHQTEKVMFVERLTRSGAVGDQIDMPDLFGGVDPINPEKSPPSEALEHTELNRRDIFGIPLTMTEYQLELLNAWANNNFMDDWPDHDPVYPDFDAIEELNQPAALDKAALEQCNGGSFHPGIEVSFIAGRSDTFQIFADSLFRLQDGFRPGSLTEKLALPWQHDYAACGELWWPGQRPISVPKRVEENGTIFVDWPLNFKGATLDEILMNLMSTTMKEAGFVRFHPEDGEIYLDDVIEETLNVLFETGSIEALQIREWLSRMRFEGGLFPRDP